MNVERLKEKFERWMIPTSHCTEGIMLNRRQTDRITEELIREKANNGRTTKELIAEMSLKNEVSHEEIKGDMKVISSKLSWHDKVITWGLRTLVITVATGLIGLLFWAAKFIFEGLV